MSEKTVSVFSKIFNSINAIAGWVIYISWQFFKVCMYTTIVLAVMMTMVIVVEENQKNSKQYLFELAVVNGFEIVDGTECTVKPEKTFLGVTVRDKKVCVGRDSTMITIANAINDANVPSDNIPTNVKIAVWLEYFGF